MGSKLTAQQRAAIALRASRGARTVDRAYAGARIEDTTRTSIARAAIELGLPPPPEQAADNGKAA
jgi:hypothetical protein